MELDHENHFLARGYTQRVPPEYFVDIDDSGIIWQPDVYPVALKAAYDHGCDVVIDLGCGRAGKLLELHESDLDMGIVGVDFGTNIDWCRANLSVGTWLEADLEHTVTLPLSAELIGRAVVVCSDVLEHLIDPRPTMQLICWLLDQGAACAVLSTPARDKRVGAQHLGPPFNPSHVREWTRDEFQAFLQSFPISIQQFELTRSDDAGGGQTTQLVVLGPGPEPT
ncbi:hypothetical protein ACWFRF_10100 [Nocardia sp. NPDC055165]|uniref:hypothetical protein n=1 Tax=Nocardia sp. NPDC060220 TaxID=3347076 RepID=UPI00365C01A9